MAKITIIDDDVEIAENLSSFLTGKGYAVSIRDTHEGALEELVSNKPDLLILDVMFPENPAGGFDLSRDIRKNAALKEIPIILLTAINQEVPMDFSAGDTHDDWMPVQDFVEKPVKYEEILGKVKKYLK